MYELMNGDKFEGELSQNVLVKGVYYYQNGDVYSGQFQNGTKHGQGVFHYVSSGEFYEGEWKNDLWHGRGLYTIASG